MSKPLFETKSWKVILLENQYYLGRLIVFFKGDAIHISELINDEFVELKEVMDKLEKTLIKSFGTTHFNWTCLMNNYYKPKNKDLEKKLHFHLWPRYEDKVVFEGEIFIDEVFGHHYDKYKEKIVTDETLDKISIEISKSLY